jgi:DNA-binding transcriptional MerR regulator
LATSEGNRKEKRTSAALPVIPDKLYFRIGEVSKLLDLPAYVLRFWETEFPQLKPNKGGTGQRLYKRREVELVLRIRGLLYDEGYTIPGARQFLKSEVRGKEAQPAPKPEAVVLQPEKTEELAPVAARLRRMRSELSEISSMLSRPVTDVPVAKPVNPPRKVLHMTSRRKHAPLAMTSLFPMDDPSTGD